MKDFIFCKNIVVYHQCFNCKKTNTVIDSNKLDNLQWLIFPINKAKQRYFKYELINQKSINKTVIVQKN